MQSSDSFSVIYLGYPTFLSAMKREEQWLVNYERLKAYIALHHQLPAKTRVENRGLLNWWKYNKRLEKVGKLSAEKAALLRELGDSRDVHQ